MRFILGILFCSPLLLAQNCPEVDFGDFDEGLNIPPIFKYQIGQTGSSFTITYDVHTKQNIINIQTSGGQNIPVDPDSARSFLNSNCPGQFNREPAPLLRTATAFPNTIFNVPTGLAAQGVAAGDFNNDGTTDSAIVTRLGVSIYLAQPDGTLRAPKSLAVSSQTEQAIVAADFNGDGNLDLAVILDGTGGGPGSIALFLGLGDGSFRSAVNIPTGITAVQMATADFNNDGKPDLAIYGGSSAKIVIATFLGNGDGTFAAPVTTPATTTTSFLAADINRDGKPDLIAAYSNQISILTGNGDGTFQPAVITKYGGVAPYLTYTDLNRDGNIDLVLYDSYLAALVVLIGNGDNTFQPAKFYAAASRASSMVVIPLGDGNTAFVVPDRLQGALLLALADSSGNLNLPKLQIIGLTGNQPLTAVLTVDLNNDGNTDIVVANSSGVATELSLGSGKFTAPVLSLTGAPITTAATADFNGDGNPDLAFSTATGVVILPGKGDGTFGAPSTNAAGDVRNLAIADFNGDGRPDIAGLDSLGNLVLLLGLADGTFQPALHITLSGNGFPGSVSSGDFNGDGKPDLIASYGGPSSAGNNLFFLAGNGDGSFAAPQRIPVPDSFQSNVTFTTGDLNNDGITDLALIFNTTDASQIAVYLGKGDGSFQAPILNTITAIPANLTLADLNGDGKADLLLGSCCGIDEPSILYGNGDGTFQPAKGFLSGANPVSFAVAKDVIVVGGYESLSKSATLTLLKPVLH